MAIGIGLIHIGWINLPFAAMYSMNYMRDGV
jgi:hypothetical protein